MIPNLPALPVTDRPGALGAETFTGLNLSPQAGAGALLWSDNLNAGDAPLLGVRGFRRRSLPVPAEEQEEAEETEADEAAGQTDEDAEQEGGAADPVRYEGSPNGIFEAGRLYFVFGTALYAWDGEAGEPPVLLTDALEDSPKAFCALGERLLIWPDKVQWTESGGLEPLGASYTAEGLVFGDGTYAGEAAQANAVTTAGEPFPFRVGDGITISGCTGATGEANNRTAVVREVSEDGRTLYFYENTFAEATGTEPGEVTLRREIPDLDYLCTNENRVWGCIGDTVWCCKLGDPKNWYVFDGLATDAFSVETGTPGRFTGCAAYLGYACFFKENRAFKAYGNKPSNFEILPGGARGAPAYGAKSFAIAGETLFYLSRSGFVAYGGGTTAAVGDALGEPLYLPDPETAPLRNTADYREYPLEYVASAGCDGRRYYASVACGDGEHRDFHLLAYDTRTGVWMREGALAAAGMAWYLGGLWAQEGQAGEDGGYITCIAGSCDETVPLLREEAVTGEACLVPFDLEAFGGKYPLRLWLRFQRFTAAARVELLLSYDSGPYEPAAVLLPAEQKADCTPAEIEAGKLRFVDRGAGTVYIPLPVGRCDHLSLYFRGTGWRLKALRLEVRTGERVRR